VNKEQKQVFIESLSEDLQKASLVIVSHQKGLTVSESTDLRNKMRAAGASFKVVKNTLAKIAVKGTKFEGLTAHLNGPAVLAFSVDPIAAAKIAVEYMNDNDKFQVVSGVLDENFLDLAAVKALAKLPSLDVLRATLPGVILAPATKLATVIKEPGASVARVISAYAKR
jgi:large subunit ribosomal protein L10